MHIADLPVGNAPEDIREFLMFWMFAERLECGSVFKNSDLEQVNVFPGVKIFRNFKKENPRGFSAAVLGKRLVAAVHIVLHRFRSLRTERE